jgi:hypothetical protein
MTEDLFNHGNIIDLATRRQQLDPPDANDPEAVRFQERMVRLQRIWDWARWMRRHGYMPDAVAEAWTEYWEEGPLG